jgi:hypothetical protein
MQDTISQQSQETKTKSSEIIDPVLELFVKQAKDQNTYFYSTLNLKENDGYAKIKTLDNAVKIELLFFLIPENIRLTKIYKTSSSSYSSQDPNYIRAYCYFNLLKSLLRTKLEFTSQELIDLLTLMRDFSMENHDYGQYFSHWPIGFMATQFEKHIKKNGLSEGLGIFINEVLSWREMQSGNGYYGSDLGKVNQKLIGLLNANDSDGTIPPYYLEEDQFGEFVNADLKKTNDAVYYELLHLASSASGSKPSKKFLAKAKSCLEKIGHLKAKPKIQSWFEFIIRLEQVWEYYQFMPANNMKVVKGLVWSFTNYHDSKSLEIIRRLAERCSKKIPGVGPTSAAITNACIYVLANSRGMEGISHLSRLRLRITQNNTKRLIQAKLDEAADKLGITPDEIEEMAVPDFGLEDGKLSEQLGDYTFEVQIEGIGKIKQTWYKSDGSIQKTAPSSIKSDKKLSEKLKKIKGKVRSIKTNLTTQRDRIDRSYISDRVWNVENWNKYYLNHGLVSWITKRLIWVFEKEGVSVTAFYLDGQWQDVKGRPLGLVEAYDTIRLWHPVMVTTDEVLEWRSFLMAHQIVQPLKQAYREVYILTDAEINTRFYSNRMAAHILKQHQFNALTALRGWRYQLLGCYDDGRDGEVARIKIPQKEMQAEFWINEVYEDGAWNDSGIWNYVATDQVRFINKTGDPIDLIDVDKLILSEILRDVDLFVGVGSVGNDPNWNDNGGLAQFRDYWTSYSFGDLNEIAKTRKQVLENLIPRLKIKEVTSIEGKFVKVKGKKRTYKIHIGSTNILMEPNDQYLCIVPARGKAETGKVFLPFDGDRGLSLILSKAMMLADDDKITDTTILSQINS